MDIYIRQAVERDQQTIRKMVREAGINPLHLNWRYFIVAVDGDVMVGCGQLRPHKDDSAELASLAVSPSYQGYGIGSVIVETLIDVHPVGLFLMCDGKMQPYYEPFGFSVISIRELPREMRFFSRLGSAFAWVARTLFRQPASMVVMQYGGFVYVGR